ncbi:superinfection exclusion B family protein [Priestia megaterium]|uniref:superinfection exclusion B family protein n=1 Tax=Priestia megaterium TaxID=1404 RepID=UPI002E21B6B2|nr:superinfection exclusion B family protein [Priestia megaterium]
MAAFDPTKLLDWIKLSPRYLFVLALVFGLLLFGPDVLLSNLGVVHFVDKFRMYIGLGFLLFSALYLVAIIHFIYTFAKDKIAERGRIKVRKDRLQNLTDEEKRILGYYIVKQVRTQSLAYNNGTVNELQRLGLIYLASRMSHGLEYFPYNITPWAWDYLNKNIHLLHMEKVEEPPTRRRGF